MASQRQTQAFRYSTVTALSKSYAIATLRLKSVYLRLLTWGVSRTSRIQFGVRLTMEVQ